MLHICTITFYRSVYECAGQQITMYRIFDCVMFAYVCIFCLYNMCVLYAGMMCNVYACYVWMIFLHDMFVRCLWYMFVWCVWTICLYNLPVWCVCMICLYDILKVLSSSWKTSILFLHRICVQIAIMIAICRYLAQQQITTKLNPSCEEGLSRQTRAAEPIATAKKGTSKEGSTSPMSSAREH